METEIEVLVRYCECDPQNVAHHSAYVVWLEIARGELLRQRGAAYRDLEACGVLFVVADLAVQYKKPARYDQTLRIHVGEIAPANDKRRRVKLEHDYRIFGDGELLATASTTLACVNRQGEIQPIPPDVLGR